jgi:hypothetical protein
MHELFRLSYWPLNKINKKAENEEVRVFLEAKMTWKETWTNCPVACESVLSDMGGAHEG